PRGVNTRAARARALEWRVLFTRAFDHPAPVRNPRATGGGASLPANRRRGKGRVATCSAPRDQRSPPFARASLASPERLAALEPPDIFGTLAPPDQTRASLVQQDDRRPRRLVVVRGHREAVRADTGYDEHGACARGRKSHRTDEDVPALAEPARHGDLLGCSGVRAPCDRRGVLRLVERRPDVVAHPTIDRDERAEAFDPLG